MHRPLHLVGSVVLAAALVSGVATASGTGGRVDLIVPKRISDTRYGGGERVASTPIGTGTFTVWAVDPSGPGTATIHPCSETAPTGEATFRLTASTDVQFATFATGENVCLTSTVPLHVAVDRRGTASATPASDRLQYVPLATPVDLWDAATTSDDQLLRLDHPAALSGAAAAAVVSLEVLTADTAGYLSASSCAHGPSLAADVGYSTERVANVAYVELGAGDDLCVLVSGPAHVRVRLLGELAPDGPDPAQLPPSWRYAPGEVPAPSLHAVTPVRVLDTRVAIGWPDTDQVEADEVVELHFGDLVTPRTTAVVLNLTARLPESGGYVTAWPCGGDRPTVSNLNFGAGDTVPNLVVSKLGPGGTVCVSGTNRTHLIADVSGTFQTDGGLLAQPVTPERILDTRRAIGVGTTTKLEPGTTLAQQVTGDDVPADAGAATINVTSAAAEGNGYLTVYPCDHDLPAASNLNYAPGDAVANLVTSKLSTAGQICIYASATTHVIADLAAWYGVDQPTGLVELAPERFLDTRDATGIATTTKAPGGEVVTLQITGRGDVPDGADAVVMNVTAVAPEAAGFVTAWPCDASMPTVSNVNYGAGETTPNLTTVKLSSSGTVCLYTLATTHLLADVAGYLTQELVAGQELILQ